MHDSTSIRVSRATRDQLRELAVADAVSLDRELALLLRAERQRRMGTALAEAMQHPDEDGWVTVNLDAIDPDARG